MIEERSVGEENFVASPVQNVCAVSPTVAESVKNDKTSDSDPRPPGTSEMISSIWIHLIIYFDSVRRMHWLSLLISNCLLSLKEWCRTSLK